MNKKGLVFNSLISIIIILVVVIVITISASKAFNIAKEGVFSSIGFLDNILGFSSSPIKTITFENGNFNIKFKDSYNDKLVIKTVYNNGNSDIDHEEAVNLKDKKELSYNINFDLLDENLFSRIDFEIWDEDNKMISKLTYFVIYPEFLERKSFGDALTNYLLELFNPKIFPGDSTKPYSSSAKVYEVFDKVFFPNNDYAFVTKFSSFCNSLSSSSCDGGSFKGYNCVEKVRKNYEGTFFACSHPLFGSLSSKSETNSFNVYSPFKNFKTTCNYNAKIVFNSDSAIDPPLCDEHTDKINIVVDYNNLPSNAKLIEYNNKKFIFIKKTW